MVGIMPSALSFYTTSGVQSGASTTRVQSGAQLPRQLTGQAAAQGTGQRFDGLELLAGLLINVITKALLQVKGLGTSTTPVTNTVTQTTGAIPTPVANTVTLPTGAAPVSQAQIGSLANNATLRQGLTALNGDAMGRGLLQNALVRGTKIMSAQEARNSNLVPQNAKNIFIPGAQGFNPNTLAVQIESTPPIIIIGDRVSNDPAELDAALREELFHNVRNQSINTVAQTKGDQLRSLGVNLANLQQAPVNSYVEEGGLTKKLTALARGETITTQDWLSTLNRYALPYLNNNQANDDAVSDAAIDSSIAGALAMGVNPAQLRNLRGAVEQFRQSNLYLNSNAARRGNNN